MGKLRVLDRFYALFGVPAATMRVEAIRRADHAIALAHKVSEASGLVLEQHMQAEDDPYIHMMRRLDETLK